VRTVVGSGRIFWLVAAMGAVACADRGSTPASEGDAGGAAGASGAPRAGWSGGGADAGGKGGTSAQGGAGAQGGATVSGTGGENHGGAALAGGADAGGADAGGAGSGGMAGAGASTAGAGIAGDVAGAGAGAGAAGGGGCDFVVNHEVSAAIGTVQVVTWSVPLPDLKEARIEFGLSGAEPALSAPVDLEEPEHRTLLLGMKAARDYSFRVVASDGETTCTSPEFSFTTGALPSTLPAIVKTAQGDGFKGFFVTSPGVASLGASDGQPHAYIFDTDGDIVWWSPMSTREISRSRMSWDGKQMWSVRAPGGSTFYSVSMDGLTETVLAGLERPHHDFAPLPDGGVAALNVDGTGTEGRDVITELGADGTLTTIADIGDLLAAPSSGAYHPNALRYHAHDDSFTVSELNTNAFVKLTRSGELVWQLGGMNPRGASFTLVELEPWIANHGHDLLEDGRFVFFNNGRTGQADSRILEVTLDETAWTATKTREYADAAVTYFLGDAAYLPSGHLLVTYSNMGLIQEVDAAGSVVQSFQGTTFGYVEFRTSLYGPPLQ
jgi:hypothetical protein